MELVFNDRRDGVAGIEHSRGKQAEYNISFMVQLWYSEDPRLYVQILKRTIYHTASGERAGGDESSESILNPQRFGLMVREACKKLDDLSFDSFCGDWCIAEGGYQVLSLIEKKEK